MTLTAGTRLGPYELSEMLGAGGMGEVYKARDTRLERSVAIKVLPSHLSSNPSLRERFEREARAISSISHPNICALYDVGSTPGAEGSELHYLVMEYLEGESLADRLTKGPLPLEQVLRYGVEIASALDKAHRAGIVHRDLKPGNIMLTRSGAKLLDFGLAKYAQSAHSVERLTNLPTEHKPLTQEGTILGTFQYMAPEQLAGEDADARTDIFAFGAVLYEMLTGARAFQGKNKTSLIGAIVSGEPRPVSALQPLTPLALEHVIRKCLAKEPDDRWQSAHDIAEELKWISEAGSQAGVPSVRISHKRIREAAAWTLFALAAALAAALALQMPRGTRRTTRLSIPLPSGSEMVPTGLMNLAISPDGSRIVFALTPVHERLAGSEQRPASRLYVRSTSRFDSVPLAGTEGAEAPFFSPDGQWIAFAVDGSLKKISLNGGAPQTICRAPNMRGGAWAADGTIYFTPRPPAGIWKVSSSGGEPERVTEPDRKSGENSHRWPQLLPGDKQILFTIRTDRIDTFDDARIGVVSLDTGRWTTVVQGASFARYVPTGHLMYGRGGVLYTVRFDLERLKPVGTAVPIIERVAYHPHTGGYHSGFSKSGDLVYISEKLLEALGLVNLDWIAPDGSREKVTAVRSGNPQRRVSPDGQRIAMTIPAANDDIWIFDTQRGTLSRLSFESGDEYRPVWTPDGLEVIYSAGDGNRLLVLAADGSGAPRELVTAPLVAAEDVSRDGSLLAYSARGEKSGRDLWLLPLSPAGKPSLLLGTPFNEVEASFSPDARLIAYTSDESGRPEVYVRTVRSGGGRQQVSVAGGFDPRWSHKTGELYFRRGLNEIHAGAVTLGDRLSVGNPRLVHRVANLDAYDISRDGRMLVSTYADQQFTVSKIDVVLNWFDELRTLVPDK